MFWSWTHHQVRAARYIWLHNIIWTRPVGHSVWWVHITGYVFGTCLSSIISVKTHCRHLMPHPFLVSSTVVSTTLTRMSQRCWTCRKVRKILIARLLRLKDKARRPLVQTAGVQLKRAVRTLRRRNRKVHTLKEVVRKLREKNSFIKRTSFEEKAGYCTFS